MIRYATIGTSWITRGFIGGCALTGEFELAAVYSRKEETGRAFADEFGCKKVICDLNELAACEDIDAVYIASPNAFHYVQSKLMLKNKKHVICEKPITTSCKQLKELQKIADVNNVIFMEAIIERHLPARKTVLEALTKIGSIKQARFDFSQRSSRYESYLKGEKVNIFSPEMAAGTLMDLGIYCVYAAVDFLGMPESICAKASTLTTGADDSGAAIFLYSDKTVTLTYTKTAAGVLGSEIQGDNGTLKIRSISKLTGVSLHYNDNRCENLVGEFEKAELMSGEAQSFANYINHFDIFESDYRAAADLAVQVHTCMDEIRKSAGINFITDILGEA